MKRRQLLQATAFTGTTLATGLAGCNALGNSSTHVTTNEFGDELTVTYVDFSQTEIGSNQVGTTIEIELENTTTDQLDVGIATRLYENDTKVVETGYPELHAEYEFDPEETRTVQEKPVADTDNVTDYEIDILDPEDHFINPPDVSFDVQLDVPETSRFQIEHAGDEPLPMDPVTVTGPGVTGTCQPVTSETTDGDHLLPTGGCDYTAGDGPIRIDWTSPETGRTETLKDTDTI